MAIFKQIKNIRTFGKAAFNENFNKVYNSIRPVFIKTLGAQYPNLSDEYLEELYNDTMLDFYKMVEDGKLKELTCSLQTFILRMGRNKCVDLIRKIHPQSKIIYMEDIYSFADVHWEPDNEDDKRKKEIVTAIVGKMENPCREILFLYYYKLANMSIIAEKIGYKSADVAKTRKNVCMKKLKAIAKCDFELNGLL